MHQKKLKIYAMVKLLQSLLRLLESWGCFSYGLMQLSFHVHQQEQPAKTEQAGAILVIPASSSIIFQFHGQHLKILPGENVYLITNNVGPQITKTTSYFP